MEVRARTADQLGHAIKRFRQSKELSQVETGKRSGLRQATISNLESGDVASQLKTLEAVLAALDLELIVQEREKETANSWREVFLSAE